MPRYFFDTRDGASTDRDEEGLEMPSADHARQEAERALADMARDILPDGEMRDLEIDVRDESGVIFVARMRMDGASPSS